MRDFGRVLLVTLSLGFANYIRAHSCSGGIGPGFCTSVPSSSPVLVSCTIKVLVSCTIKALVSCTIKASVSCTIKALVSCTIKALVSYTSSVRCNSGSRLGGRFPVSVTAHVLCIKLLSTGACANITIREIMLINIISSASWTLHM